MANRMDPPKPNFSPIPDSSNTHTRLNNPIPANMPNVQPAPPIPKIPKAQVCPYCSSGCWRCDPKIARSKMITCPYCFEEFGHGEVYFRMETVFFSEEECDPLKQGRTEEEIELSGDKIALEKFRENKKFLAGESERYKSFWSHYSGGSREKSPTNKQGRERSIPPQIRPILSAKSPLIKSAKLNEEGILYAVRDTHMAETTRRVCPHCHNPLPSKYGASVVKFVSVIGITGAGKTVFLSQLCKHFGEFCSNVGITSTPTSTAAMDFCENNPIRMGQPLPEGTVPGGLSQPICFDLSIKKEDRILSNTIVFYDISGEDCVDDKGMEKFAGFIKHSNGIILLLDPLEQFSGDYQSAPENVMDAIYNYFPDKKKVSRLPICVTISKGDTVSNQIISGNFSGVVPIRNDMGVSLPLFNAGDYAPVQKQVKMFIQTHQHQLRTRLNNLFGIYNYFLVSSLGGDVETAEGEGGSVIITPAAPPFPKRLEEPLYWLFFQFGYIGCRGQIPFPEDINPPKVVKTWDCVNEKCLTEKISVNRRYCPKCFRDIKGNKMPLGERIKEKLGI